MISLLCLALIVSAYMVWRSVLIADSAFCCVSTSSLGTFNTPFEQVTLLTPLSIKVDLLVFAVLVIFGLNGSSFFDFLGRLGGFLSYGGSIG